MESRTQCSKPRPRTQKKSEAKAKVALPRTDPFEAKDTGASVLRKKRSSKIFFRRSPTEENKKRSSQIFREVFGVFQQNFYGSKRSAVREPRTGQFSRSRPRTSKSVLEDSTSGKTIPRSPASDKSARVSKVTKTLLVAVR